MISYLSGKIILKKPGFIILETAGVGYQVFLSTKSTETVPTTGAPFKLFTYLDVCERSLKLFGFLTYDELELFSLVRNISGVGPKAALEISAFGPLDKIKREIMDGDASFLHNISGIGQKKAQKIILELSGKLKELEPKNANPKQDKFEKDEAFLALCNLGFPKDKCKAALSQIPDNITNPQERVKQSLQILGK
jgi:Holliday junction DNA helicase RuvA